MGRLALFLAAGMLAALAACAPRAAVHDKAFYAAHADVRAKAVAACEANPGGVAGTPDCVNAAAADADAHASHFWDAPKPASRVKPSGQL
ncbi:MAG: EexN family lipoprotein [Caulobacteraceae bacterium]|nr:EexN family lipoprotein [Caulobacteraceae bacterium]